MKVTIYGDGRCLECGLIWSDSDTGPFIKGEPRPFSDDKTDCPRCGSRSCTFTPQSRDEDDLYE
jgi:DNA-directed RNA polymerase subunit RPC12/RpoP